MDVEFNFFFFFFACRIGGMRPPNMGPLGSSGPSGAGPAAPPGPAGAFPDVDLSHLSEEERALIESVMMKAQMEELDPVKPVSRLASPTLLDCNLFLIYLQHISLTYLSFSSKSSSCSSCGSSSSCYPVRVH